MELDQQLTEGLTADILEQRDPYAFFMQNEPHLNKIEPQIDPETGWRYTYRDIGMVRNASEAHTKEMKVFLEPIPHVVLPEQNVQLRGWYKGKYEPDNVRPRPCMTDALLTQPYGGFCAVGCAFCYINHGVRGYRGQGLATVDPLYGGKIRKQIEGMRIGTAVYMSSFIDPFLELEDHYHNTRDTSQAAVDHGLPIFFLTRKHVPGWAYDHLKLNKHSYMQFSINTSKPDDWRKLSPRAESLEHQIEQVREMRRQGIYVSIQVNPIVAGVVSNDDIVELIHMLAEAGADHLIFKFVEISYPAVQAMIQQMKVRFGEARGQAFGDLFTCNIGGQRTIDEAYRKAALDRFSIECKKAGVTMSLCYEYEYERDASGNILSKRGKSMGFKYLTADQCHGHRVPIYHRQTGQELFQPMDVCNNAGCLSCGDEFGGDDKVPCGSRMLGSAPKLMPVDYKNPIDLSKYQGRFIPLRRADF